MTRYQLVFIAVLALFMNGVCAAQSTDTINNVNGNFNVSGGSILNYNQSGQGYIQVANAGVNQNTHVSTKLLYQGVLSGDGVLSEDGSTPLPYGLNLLSAPWTWGQDPIIYHGGFHDFRVIDGDQAETLAVRITSSGNIGIGTATTNGHKVMVRDAPKDGIDWSFAVNNPANVQGSSSPAVGIKLSLSTEEAGGNESHKWSGILAYTEPGAEYGNSMGLAIYTNQGAGGGQAPTEKMRIRGNGNVGIGVPDPGEKLVIDGNLKLKDGSGGHIIFPNGSVQSEAWTGTLCGGDYAESVDVSDDRARYEPGDLLVIDPRHPGRFIKSAEPYSTAVTGVYSTKPGLVGRRQTTPQASSTSEVPMAMIGIVPTKVSAENGPIRPGDILVSSSIPGHAMKGTDRSLFAGAVVGKALGALDSGTGVIEVVVSLQ